MPSVANLLEQAERTVAGALHHVDRQSVMVGFHGPTVAGLRSVDIGTLVLQEFSRRFLEQLLVNGDCDVAPRCGSEPAIDTANGLTGHNIADLRCGL